jgi:hypothetical protein
MGQKSSRWRLLMKKETRWVKAERQQEFPKSATGLTD